jgi:hypothetical protein
VSHDRGRGLTASADAGRVEFTPSADHNLVTDSIAHVTSYELRIFNAGTSELVRSVDLGKPSPQSDGFIRMDYLSRLSTPLAAGRQYEARVAAIGPGGTAVSDPSNQFSFTLTCTPTLSAASASLPAPASGGSVTVTAADGCEWSASSPAGWLTITSGTEGTGTAAVTFSATANAATTSRSATLTIAGHSFTVTQAAADPDCTYTIAPTSRTSPSAGESITVNVTTGSGCGWSASRNATWLTVNNGSNRTGSGSVTVVVAANTSTSQRTGTANIAGVTFTVDQDAAPCAFTISPTSRTSPAAGESITVTVTTSSGCEWSASRNATWLTVNNGTNRSGSGSVTVVVAAHTGTSQRSGTATIAGRTFTVNQSGVSCSSTVSPRTISAASTGRTGTISVTVAASCTWSVTGVPGWIMIPGGVRTGSGTASYTVIENMGAARNVTVMVAGRSVSVTQAAPTTPSAPSGVRVVPPGGQ